MKRIELTSEWLSNWNPKRKDEEVADRGCRGLVFRGQPGGIKSAYRWTNERNPATGVTRRRRVKLGRWPALSLNEARGLVNEAKETQRTETSGALVTVAQLAEAYRRDILVQREPASLAWSWGIIRTHVLPALPDKNRPPFGEWLARDVRPPDVAAVIRAARVERTVEVVGKTGEKVSRSLGGPAAARATLRELKALFAAAVGAGSLSMTPAGVLQATALGLKSRPRGRRLDGEELAALFKALDLNAVLAGTAKQQKLSETVRLAVALLYYAPVRSHSLVSAKWEEIDLGGASWTIPVEKMKLHGDDRPDARPFAVPLPATAVAILRRLQELAGSSPWVLASPKNPKKHIGPKVVVRAVARLQESGRLSFGSRFNIHDARRWWRSKAADLGVSFEVAEVSLAHKLPGMARIYNQAEMTKLRTEAAELVGAALDKVRLGKAAKVVPLADGRRQGLLIR